MSSSPLPMLATLGRPPESFSDFAVEAKYDGQRGIAIVDSGAVTLLSRNGADITRTFPEITAALSSALGARSPGARRRNCGPRRGRCAVIQAPSAALAAEPATDLRAPSAGACPVVRLRRPRG